MSVSTLLSGQQHPGERGEKEREPAKDRCPSKYKFAKSKSKTARVLPRFWLVCISPVVPPCPTPCLKTTSFFLLLLSLLSSQEQWKRREREQRVKKEEMGECVRKRVSYEGNPHFCAMCWLLANPHLLVRSSLGRNSRDETARNVVLGQERCAMESPVIFWRGEVIGEGLKKKESKRRREK